MPKLAKILLGAAAAMSIYVSSAQAIVISFTPTSAPGVAETPAFGALAPGGTLGTNYNTFGVDFSYGGVEGYFNDLPKGFGGINGSGVLDLLSPVDGRIVKQGTGIAAVTDFFYAEAGFAGAGSLTLELFNSANVLIASILNGNPLGANSRTTFSYSGAGIASFKISGNDTFGVNEIRLNTPTVSAVPLPAGLPLLVAGLGALGFVSRKGRKKA